MLLCFPSCVPQIVILMWTGNNVTRPFRVAGAAALALLIDKGLKKIQKYFNFPNPVYAFALVVSMVAVPCLAVVGLLTSLDGENEPLLGVFRSCNFWPPRCMLFQTTRGHASHGSITGLLVSGMWLHTTFECINLLFQVNRNEMN